MVYKRFGGRFKNNLVLRTFAAHLKAVEGVEWVEGLAFDMDEYPRGALALSATAVSVFYPCTHFI